MIGKTNSVAGGKLKPEMLNLTLKTNQASHTDLVGATFTVAYADVSTEYTWAGNEMLVEIPPYVEYSITFGSVNNYKKPDTYSSTAVEGNSKTLEFEYKTEVVSVTLSADDGSSVNGAKVTINGVTQTWNGTVLTQKVAFGTEYSVSVSDMDGYATPDAQTGLVASQSSLNLAFVYVASALKVTISSNQGTDATIAAVKATVAYGSTSIEVSSGESIVVPSGTSGTVTFPEVEGYLAPDPVSFTHTSGVTEISGEYKCELLTVNVSADQGSISGYEITISKQETVGVSTKYTRLEYIEGNGSQYIDTGITASDDLEVEVSFKPTSAISEGAIFGADWSTNGYFMMYYNSLWRFHTRGYVFDSSSSIDTSDFTVIRTTTNSITINGSESTWSKGSTSDSSSSIWLLYCNGTYTAKKYGYGRVAYMKMWKGGVLVRDYIPALRSDGIAGLYDKVNDTFTASSGSGNFVAGSNAKEVIATQTSVTGTYKIPHGTSYAVEANSIAGYITPSVYGKTADSQLNIVSMQYIYNSDPGITSPANGVYIQSTDGKFYTSDNWIQTKTPNGVAVVTTNVSFVISLESKSDVPYFTGDYPVANVPSGITWYEEESEALLSYDSKTETDNLVEWFGNDSTTAQGWATSYVFPNGKTGFLPSFGVCKSIVDNLSLIKQAYTTLGNTFYAYYLLSSTIKHFGTAQCFMWSFYMLKEEDINVYTMDASNSYYTQVWAITDL